MAPKTLFGTAALVLLGSVVLLGGAWPLGAGWPGLAQSHSESVEQSQAESEEKVDYQKQIRPILSDFCYECHGEDGAAREADLRLDRKEGVFGDLGGYSIIVPGDPEDSELYLRISAEFEEERMPPYDAGTELLEEEIEVIRLWIEQGAEWEDEP